MFKDVWVTAVASSRAVASIAPAPIDTLPPFTGCRRGPTKLHLNGETVIDVTRRD
jgi:hypothetical protein